MLFWQTKIEIKSDLYYKVTTTDNSTFSYQRNNRLLRENVKTLYLRPGDWVVIEDKKELNYEERGILNFAHMFYLKFRSVFNLTFQILILLGYAYAYVSYFSDFNIDDINFITFTVQIIFEDIILFLPLIFLFFKTIKTLSRAITIIGPNSQLKGKFSMIESITIVDKSGKKRTIMFNDSSKMVEDELGTYRYGGAEKISSNIYKFDLLIFNKKEKPLFNIENYILQVDFKQLEGILISKGKKLEHSNVKLNQYKTHK